jgi:hypothetical protein
MNKCRGDVLGEQGRELFAEVRRIDWILEVRKSIFCCIEGRAEREEGK